MHESTLAKRYATALAELVAKDGQLELVASELDSFWEMVRDNSAIRSHFESPTTSSRTQHELLTLFLQKQTVLPLTANFLRLLVDKRRMPLLESIVRAFRKEMEKRAGIVTVNVTTSTPLNDTRKEEMSSMFTQITGRKVQLELRDDPDLLGGMVVQVGSLMIDSSVRNHLNRLKALLKA